MFFKYILNIIVTCVLRLYIYLTFIKSFSENILNTIPNLHIWIIIKNIFKVTVLINIYFYVKVWARHWGGSIQHDMFFLGDTLCIHTSIPLLKHTWCQSRAWHTLGYLINIYWISVFFSWCGLSCLFAMTISGLYFKLKSKTDFFVASLLIFSPEIKLLCVFYYTFMIIYTILH